MKKLFRNKTLQLILNLVCLIGGAVLGQVYWNTVHSAEKEEKYTYLRNPYLQLVYEEFPMMCLRGKLYHILSRKPYRIIPVLSDSGGAMDCPNKVKVCTVTFDKSEYTEKEIREEKEMLLSFESMEDWGETECKWRDVR